MTQILVTHRVFLLIIIQVGAREKHGIRRHPGHKHDYYIIQPYAEKLHNKIINKVIYHELPEQERSEFQTNINILQQ